MKHYFYAFVITTFLIAIGMYVSYAVGHYGKIKLQDQLGECRDKIGRECVCY
jgi:choline-glycine betaine transporter